MEKNNFINVLLTCSMLVFCQPLYAQTYYMSAVCADSPTQTHPNNTYYCCHNTATTTSGQSYFWLQAPQGDDASNTCGAYLYQGVAYTGPDQNCTPDQPYNINGSENIFQACGSAYVCFGTAATPNTTCLQSGG